MVLIFTVWPWLEWLCCCVSPKSLLPDWEPDCKQNRGYSDGNSVNVSIKKTPPGGVSVLWLLGWYRQTYWLEYRTRFLLWIFLLLTEDLPTAPCARRVNDSTVIGPGFNIYTNSTKFTSTCCGEKISDRDKWGKSAPRAGLLDLQCQMRGYCRITEP